MVHETLPDWVWLLFYSFIALTLLATITNLFKKVHIKASIINLTFVIATPVISFTFALGRPEGNTEWDHLITGMLSGSPWAIIILLGCSFMLYWWFRFSFLFVSLNS
ncbi:hypothetical protein M1K46_06260 [Fictibacillus sp. WQ 8-8]|uniref:hypothetical protein n=1 Tax=unclassified Fictibacillus TaxID=2644029 RepID=UPI0006A75DAE|nr:MULTISPECIES: hypothetical protein [unclassified Fictibacillus]MCQ6265262.1 hypothetical protein [Fictibacillus sp. WQ 8-8]MED2971939.1 hypothetical protein [Fictibacillus sp. B-59209]SFE00644.1 hypothetical protein SAMN05428981_10371 [Bacillus sp. OV194]